MPNHVKNVLTFEGSQLAIDELFKTIEGTEDGRHMDIDFNKIIPMPESLNIEDGSKKDIAVRLYMSEGYERHCIIQDNKISESEAKRLIQIGEKYCYNKLNYNHFTWYDWRWDNWGTKWNAYEIERVNDTLIFQTAWSTPVPIITKISEMFPTITIRHRFADEDIGNNCGDYTWRSGDIVHKEVMDDEEAEQFALDLWGWERYEDEEKS